MQKIIVVDYDPIWPKIFEQIHSGIWPVLNDVALAIEHVGSTSVIGLAAKPIIDMSVIVPTAVEIQISIDRLAKLGYVHRGNLGIDGREAFISPEGTPAHYLYLCPQNSLGLANQLAVRDYLRTHAATAEEYSKLKKQLANDSPNDIMSYIHGKTDLIIKILKSAKFSPDQLKMIERANRKS